jgi:hypothetical protein
MNWHKRRHSLGTFCRTTTPEEAGEIPRVVPVARPPPIPEVAIPRVVPRQSSNAGAPSPLPAQNLEELHRLFPPGSDGETEARLVVDGAAGDKWWKGLFLETATRDWIARFGRLHAVPVDQLTLLVVTDGSPSIRANLGALLAFCRPPGTVDGDLLSFTDYLALMLRFGAMDRLRQSIKGLTGSKPSGGRGPFDGFVTWFRPTMTDEEANAAVRGARVGTWLIRLSSIANEFTLHWRATDCFPPLVCRIRYDGLATLSRIYAAISENEDTQFAGSWRGLIVSRLGLRLEDAFGSPW